jgi:phosphatidylserine synthase
MRKASMLPAFLAGALLIYVRVWHPEYLPTSFAVVTSIATCWLAYITFRVWRFAQANSQDRETRAAAAILLLLTLACAYGVYLAFNLPVPRAG